MSFYIRCAKGHRNFTIRIMEAQDGDGEPMGFRLLLLSCEECSEEAVLEIAE